MNQFTLRKIPKEVEKRLRELAEETDSSINKTVIALLEKALNLKPSETKYRDLSKLNIKWTKEEVDIFEKNTKIFEKIDEEMWK